MIDKIAGDTIVFEANLTGTNGSAITDATASLVVLDFAGSTVLSSTAPHTAVGTYQKSVTTLGWNKGPITEHWKFTNGAGTMSQVVNNLFRIVGTETITPYIFPVELRFYYENIEEYFDGDEEAQVVNAFNEINAKLESVGYKMPIRPKADGYYDQPLRDLNAYAAITRIVSKRQAGYGRGDEKPWFAYFEDLSGSIYRKIENKTYNFDRDYSVSESGIGIGTKAVGTRPGQMETNWRGGIGTGFQDWTFERDWVVQVTGTGTAGEVNEGTYKWSNDSGLTFATACKTDFEWTHLKDGVYVRFHRGTGTSGTTNIFAADDKWTFKTFPSNQTVAGKRTARSY